MDRIFIKMCKEATEIQEGWEPMGGDRVIVTQFGQIGLEYLSKGIEDKKGSLMYHKSGSIWLPRQEDLQKIYMEVKEEAPGDVLNQFYEFHIAKKERKEVLPSIRDFNTVITMYWLVLVMETVYNKRWNGNTWEVI